MLQTSRRKLLHHLKHNGYPVHQIFRPKRRYRRRKREQSQHDWSNCAKLRLPFISDAVERRIKQLIYRKNLPIRLVPITGPKLTSSLRTDNTRGPPKCINKHLPCVVCNSVGSKVSCASTNVVYRYQCSICNKLYIGETSRQLLTRHKEHASAIQTRSRTSAISEHLINDHAQEQPNISLYHMTVLRATKNSKENAIAEAQLIKTMRPQLNRKHENKAL